MLIMGWGGDQDMEGGEEEKVGIEEEEEDLGLV